MAHTGMKVTAALIALTMAGAAFAEMGPIVIGPGSYGQELVTRVIHKNRNVDSLTLYVVVPHTSNPQAIASTTGKTGTPATATAKKVLVNGKAHFGYVAGQLTATMPMRDVSGKNAGVMTISLKGSSRQELEHEALAIRTYLQRNTSYAANLVQKALWDKNLPLNSYAQDLVDSTLERHRDVLIMAIHAATPKNATPEILASNIGRIGKPDDSDDARVVNLGKTNLENNTGLQRYEVELPLNDSTGKRIGALGVVFPLTKNIDEKARHEEAIRIRDELARKIPSAAKLIETTY